MPDDAATARLEPPLIGAIEGFLQEALTSLTPLPASSLTAGRPRVLPSLCLWGGVLVCLLRGATTQTAVWRLLTHTGLWAYPRVAVSDQAIYRRLDRESAGAGAPPLLARLFVQVTTLLTARLAPYAETTLAPFATDVLALDETALDQVPRWLPALRDAPPRADALRPGKLACLFDLRRQVFRHVVHVAAAHQNEKQTAPTLLPQIAAGALLVFDRGYFSFPWFDALTDRGIFWVSRLRAQTSYTVVHSLYQRGATRDCLVRLGAYRANQAQHLVRLVEFRVGAVHYRYLTNQCDPLRFPLRMLAQVYLRRWDIECAFQLIKEHLHLRLLWSSKPQVLLAQVWGVLIISQILQALRLEIARRAGVEPFDVSLPLLVGYVPDCLRRGEDPVTVFVQEGRRLGFLRPSPRSENRAPTIPRDQLRLPPPDLVRAWPPRYDRRKCGPRSRTPGQAPD